MRPYKLPEVTKKTLNEQLDTMRSKEGYIEWFDECKARLERDQPQLMAIVYSHADIFGDAAGRVMMQVIDLLEIQYNKNSILPSKN